MIWLYKGHSTVAVTKRVGFFKVIVSCNNWIEQIVKTFNYTQGPKVFPQNGCQI